MSIQHEGAAGTWISRHVIRASTDWPQTTVSDGRELSPQAEPHLWGRSDTDPYWLVDIFFIGGFTYTAVSDGYTYQCGLFIAALGDLFYLYTY